MADLFDDIRNSTSNTESEQLEKQAQAASNLIDLLKKYGEFSKKSEMSTKRMHAVARNISAISNEIEKVKEQGGDTSDLQRRLRDQKIIQKEVVKNYKHNITLANDYAVILKNLDNSVDGIFDHFTQQLKSGRISAEEFNESLSSIGKGIDPNKLKELVEYMRQFETYAKAKASGVTSNEDFEKMGISAQNIEAFNAADDLKTLDRSEELAKLIDEEKKNAQETFDAFGTYMDPIFAAMKGAKEGDFLDKLQKLTDDKNINIKDIEDSLDKYVKPTLLNKIGDRIKRNTELAKKFADEMAHSEKSASLVHDALGKIGIDAEKAKNAVVSVPGALAATGAIIFRDLNEAFEIFKQSPELMRVTMFHFNELTGEIEETSKSMTKLFEQQHKMNTIRKSAMRDALRYGFSEEDANSVTKALINTLAPTTEITEKTVKAHKENSKEIMLTARATGKTTDEIINKLTDLKVRFGTSIAEGTRVIRMMDNQAKKALAGFQKLPMPLEKVQNYLEESVFTVIEFKDESEILSKIWAKTLNSMLKAGASQEKALAVAKEMTDIMSGEKVGDFTRFNEGMMKVGRNADVIFTKLTKKIAETEGITTSQAETLVSGKLAQIASDKELENLSKEKAITRAGGREKFSKLTDEDQDKLVKDVFDEQQSQRDKDLQVIVSALTTDVKRQKEMTEAILKAGKDERQKIFASLGAFALDLDPFKQSRDIFEASVESELAAAIGITEDVGARRKRMAELISKGDSGLKQLEIEFAQFRDESSADFVQFLSSLRVEARDNLKAKGLEGKELDRAEAGEIARLFDKDIEKKKKEAADKEKEKPKDPMVAELEKVRIAQEAGSKALGNMTKILDPLETIKKYLKSLSIVTSASLPVSALMLRRISLNTSRALRTRYASRDGAGLGGGYGPGGSGPGGGKKQPPARRHQKGWKGKLSRAGDALKNSRIGRIGGGALSFAASMAGFEVLGGGFDDGPDTAPTKPSSGSAGGTAPSGGGKPGGKPKPKPKGRFGKMFGKVKDFGSKGLGKAKGLGSKVGLKGVGRVASKIPVLTALFGALDAVQGVGDLHAQAAAEGRKVTSDDEGARAGASVLSGATFGLVSKETIEKSPVGKVFGLLGSAGGKAGGWLFDILNKDSELLDQKMKETESIKQKQLKRIEELRVAGIDQATAVARAEQELANERINRWAMDKDFDIAKVIEKAKRKGKSEKEIREDIKKALMKSNSSIMDFKAEELAQTAYIKGIDKEIALKPKQQMMVASQRVGDNLAYDSAMRVGVPMNITALNQQKSQQIQKQHQMKQQQASRAQQASTSDGMDNIAGDGDIKIDPVTGEAKMVITLAGMSELLRKNDKHNWFSRNRNEYF